MIKIRCLVPYSRLLIRSFHHEFSNSETIKPEKENIQEKKMPFGMRNKFKVFKDEDSKEIFDVEEERQRYQIQDEPDQPCKYDYFGLNLNRGITGVYNIEDLVEVLRKEQAEDIFVCRVPKELKYVDYMVVATGRSFRHMASIAEFTRHMFKKKRSETDILPKIEGEKSRDWMALDLGNIALHIFSQDAREIYDLESLWSLGPAYDKESNKPKDSLVELFEKTSNLLNNMKSKT